MVFFEVFDVALKRDGIGKIIVGICIQSVQSVLIVADAQAFIFLGTKVFKRLGFEFGYFRFEFLLLLRNKFLTAQRQAAFGGFGFDLRSLPAAGIGF